jgi:rhamnosyltransferase
MAFKPIFSGADFSLCGIAPLKASNIASDLVHGECDTRPCEHVSSIVWFGAAPFWGMYQGYKHASPVTQQLRETFYYPRGHAGPDDPERPVEPLRHRE